MATIKRTLTITIRVEYDDDQDPMGKDLTALEDDIDNAIASNGIVTDVTHEWDQKQEGGN